MHPKKNQTKPNKPQTPKKSQIQTYNKFATLGCSVSKGIQDDRLLHLNTARTGKNREEGRECFTDSPSEEETDFRERLQPQQNHSSLFCNCILFIPPS